MKKENNMNRRDFIKFAGGAVAAGAAAAALGNCGLIGSREDNGDLPKGQMTYRINPKSGDRLSLLGYGMMRLPMVQRRRGESQPDTNDIDQEAVNALVDTAIENGVNVFDTAPGYGKGFSETATGEALSRHPRDKYFVSTKLSNMRGDSAQRDASVRMYENSFRALKVDYIDYYFCHNMGSREAFQTRFINNGMLDFLLREKEAGRIRQIGFSFHGDGEFFEQVTGEFPWDFAMIQLNYLDWGNIMSRRTTINAQRQYEILAEKNIPAWIMEPLLGGALAMPHYQARERMMQEDPAASSASWAFRFAGSLPNVAVVLSGMTFMDHLKDNIKTFSPLLPLNESERNMIEEISHIMLSKRTINCTMCQYCMPCPYGLDIPEIFRHYNVSMNEGNYPDNRQSQDYRRARRAFLIGMNRKVLPERQAERCINCRLCVPSCPQRINIPNEMRRIDQFIENLKAEA